MNPSSRSRRMRAIYPSSRIGEYLISNPALSSAELLTTPRRIRCEEDYIIGLRRLYNRSKAIDSLHEEWVEKASGYEADGNIACLSESKSRRAVGRGTK